MMGLTAKQRELYDFIAATIAEKGFAPTFAEMRDAIGSRSTSRVSELVNALEERGYIRRLRARVRAIDLVERPQFGQPAAVTLNHEILSLTDAYAKEHGISRDTAANELLRQALGAAA